MTAAGVIRRLRALADPAKAAFLSQYFKTGPGEYGEGDRFIGVIVPDSRKVAREFDAMPLPALRTLLKSPWHEGRLVALLIMVRQFECGNEPRRHALHDLYLANLPRINNWDLIDTSAPTLVGGHLLGKKLGLLDRLAVSPRWNERRVAVVATLYFIKRDRPQPTLRLCRRLITDRHDLLHKACGWMLREIGQRDRGVMLAFLNKHAGAMPRTMLRYALEKLPPAERKRFMQMRS